MGRATARSLVDVNVSEENDTLTANISRRQAIIGLHPDDCEFYLKNLGKVLIFVNGSPVERGKKRKLYHNSLIEVPFKKFFFFWKFFF
jgi:hypothetical protein